MSVRPYEKDVEDQLLRSRTSRRDEGDVPFPFQYTRGMVDFDVWDHMFFVNSMRSLTVHRFEKPPKQVLDLGCGGGFWAMEAAKQWTSSTITGFDIANIQPNLHELPHLRSLARRIKWVHGNLLDGLPFREASFDFVRLAFLGLGIPEDEWQCVLEEVSRVLKPDGVLEVIEEDLLFPCTTVPIEPPHSPQFNLDLSLLTFTSPRPSPVSSTHDLVSVSSDKKPTSPLKLKLLDLTRIKSPKMQALVTPVSPTVSEQGFLGGPAPKHPQDHSKIKACWEAMLAHRFLASRLLSVLPFYLSAYFPDVKFNAPYKVPLPPNSSHSAPPLRQRHSDDSIHPTPHGHLDSPYDLKMSSVPRGKSMRGVYPYGFAASQWSTMHLARTVNTITACKEPMFHEYERLYIDEYNFQYFHSNVTLRQVFDRDWNSWQNDMKDRMGIRDQQTSSLAWPETPGAATDCQKWRNAFEPNSAATEKPPIIHYDPNDLCRSMRSFVARKEFYD